MSYADDCEAAEALHAAGAVQHRCPDGVYRWVGLHDCGGAAEVQPEPADDPGGSVCEPGSET